MSPALAAAPGLRRDGEAGLLGWAGSQARTVFDPDSGEMLVRLVLTRTAR